MKYHFIGIGGIGMSALARILVQKGEKVSGSDINSSPVVEELKKAGAAIYIGHSEENVAIDSKVIYSSDIPHNNPEYKEAERLQLPILHRSELLKELMQEQKALLIAGSHGKTTTSSLLAHVLVASGLQPSYAIGGIVSSMGANGGFGKGEYFVAEADESDGSFLQYPGYGAIITNIDNDHMEYWKSDEGLVQGFKQFADHIAAPEHLFWCKDDEKLCSINLAGNSYGFDEKANLFIKNFEQSGWMTYFDFSFLGTEYTEIEMPLIGGYNVLNAAAVFGLALSLNVPEDKIRQSLQTFRGIGRRVEKKGESKGISFYDDYAHHPTEIFATLHAIKNAIGNKRLIVAFQPHRFTRTRDCMEQFPHVFDEADVLFITDIYSAREQPIPGITTENLIGRIREKYARDILYAERSQLPKELAKMLRPDDVLVTMGAGDVTKVGKEVLELMNG